VLFVESTLDIQRYFQAADTYLLTSTREGLPVALLEAMACGLGCIATRLERITDVLVDDGVSGCLVEPGDVAGFASALKALLTDAGMRRAMGARARTAVEDRYSVDRMVDAYLRIYQGFGGPGAD